MSCPTSEMTSMACNPWQCMTGQLATRDGCRKKRWECAGWMVFGYHDKIPVFKSPRLRCLMTILVIDWYHQRAENFLCLSENISSSVQGFFQGSSGAHLPWTRFLTWVCQKHYMLCDTLEVRVHFFPGSQQGNCEKSKQQCGCVLAPWISAQVVVTKDVVTHKYRSWSLLLWVGPYKHIPVYCSWTQVCDYLSV